MNKTVLLILTGTLALLAEGCSFFSDFADARKEIEENTAKPIPVKVNTSQAQAQETEAIEEEFADLEEEVEPIQEIAGLISATNPDVRVRSSVRGRQDPFSTVTLTPRIEIEEEDEQPSIRPNPTNRSTNRQQSRLSQSNRDDLSPPSVFEPTLAYDVIISGLYEDRGRAKLIVQAPEETTSRYVEVGQYLSNGQVLVKSIDLNHFPTPLVILEQSGVEVSKLIGENPEDSQASRISSLPIEKENFSNEALLSNASLNFK